MICSCGQSCGRTSHFLIPRPEIKPLPRTSNEIGAFSTPVSRICAGAGNGCQTACKPGSVRAVSGTRRPFLWDAPCDAPLATNPGDGAEPPLRPPVVSHGSRRPPLFGLAPDGVCPAAAVTRSAVRSYRTVSPLPAMTSRSVQAVCFLWHFPWGRPRRPLAGIVVPWSPDFPPTGCYPRQRPSGRLAGVVMAVSSSPVKSSHRAPDAPAAHDRAATGRRPHHPTR